MKNSSYVLISFALVLLCIVFNLKINDNENIEVRTWERGAGMTLACGTGAVAAVVLSSYLGKTSNVVKVKLPGGELLVEYPGYGKEAFMTGPSEKVAEGYYNYRGE